MDFMPMSFHQGGDMEILYSRCAGLDVHKNTVVACARLVEDGNARAKMETVTFGTTTTELLRLSD